VTEGSSAAQDWRNTEVRQIWEELPSPQSPVKIKTLFFFHVHAFDQKELPLGCLSTLVCLTEFRFRISSHNCVDWKTQYVLKWGAGWDMVVSTFIRLWFHH